LVLTSVIVCSIVHFITLSRNNLWLLDALMFQFYTRSFLRMEAWIDPLEAISVITRVSACRHILTQHDAFYHCLVVGYLRPRIWRRLYVDMHWNRRCQDVFYIPPNNDRRRHVALKCVGIPTHELSRLWLLGGQFKLS
jgi:hypothetical protein